MCAVGKMFVMHLSQLQLEVRIFVAICGNKKIFHINGSSMSAYFEQNEVLCMYESTFC